MEYNKAFDETQNKLLDDQSKGPGLYQLDHSLKTNIPVYPWAPGTNIAIDKEGITKDVIDTQSELLNLSRPLTNNIHLEYSPYTSKNTHTKLYGDDGFFSKVNSRLTDPAFDLKEFGINRWEWLPINPQVNSLEPFKRIGENTVLNTLDSHKTICN